MFYFMFFLNNVTIKYKNNEKAVFLVGLVRFLTTVFLLYAITFFFYKVFSVRYNVTIPLLSIAIVNLIIDKANKYEKKMDNLCH